MCATYLEYYYAHYWSAQDLKNRRALALTKGLKCETGLMAPVIASSWLSKPARSTTELLGVDLRLPCEHGNRLRRTLCGARTELAMDANQSVDLQQRPINLSLRPTGTMEFPGSLHVGDVTR